MARPMPLAAPVTMTLRRFELMGRSYPARVTMTLRSPSEAMGTFLPVNGSAGLPVRDVRRPAGHAPRRSTPPSRRGAPRSAGWPTTGARRSPSAGRPPTWRSTACAGGSSWPTGARRDGPRASASCAAARSPACATSRPRARPTSCPTLVLPPQAGHDSCIVDYSTAQSQMQTILRRRARAPLRAGLDRRHAGDQGRDDHRLPGRGGRRGAGGRRAAASTSWATARAAGWPPSTRRCTPSASTRSPSPARRSTSTPAAPSSTRASQALSDDDLSFFRALVAPGQRRAQGRVPARRLHRHQAGERGRQAAAAAGPRPRRPPCRALPGLRGLVQAHPGHRRALLSVARRAPLPRQRAHRRNAAHRRRARSTSDASTAP